MADVTIADVMQAYANDAVVYARRRLNVTLDFSDTYSRPAEPTAATPRHLDPIGSSAAAG
jgi:hypothetical protein